MTICEISKLPTSVRDIPSGCAGVHESILRAFQILDKVKYLLASGVPSPIVLELIAEMEARESK